MYGDVVGFQLPATKKKKCFPRDCRSSLICFDSTRLLGLSQPMRLVGSIRGPRSRSCGLLELNVDSSSSNDFPGFPSQSFPFRQLAWYSVVM